MINLHIILYTGTLVQGRQATPHFKLKELENKPSSEWVRVTDAHEAIISKDVVTYDDIKGETMIFLEPTKCPIEMTALQSSLP